MRDRTTGKPQPWRPDQAAGPAASGAGVKPADFARLSPAQKVELMLGMIGVVKQFGGDPKEMLRDVIRGLSPEEKARLAADPKTKAQLRALLDLL